MMINILEYLEQTAARLPDKTALISEQSSLTFSQLHHRARAVGSWLRGTGIYKKPVVVFMHKGPDTVAAFFGAVYAGCCYVPLDEEMPGHRIELIMKTLQPAMVICDEITQPLLAQYGWQGAYCSYDQIVSTAVDEAGLAWVRSRQIDTDPVYIIFTSGSTGVPKGVTVCHRSLISYIEELSRVMNFGEDTIFGNQTPLHFDASLKDLYPTMKYGASLVFIPKQLFMFPVKLIEFLNRYQINTLCWVVSALTMISAFRTFDKIKPEYLHTVGFGSEVFPIKQFNRWKEALPNVRYVNLYGPTEITGVCCYYEVDRTFGTDEVMPIGWSFRNTDVFLLDENDREPAPGEQGEICVRGTQVTLGYYCNPEMTGRAFTQNPLNPSYPEVIYRTGDLGRFNERGELVYLCRKDYQIKHMGHRIELGEIEAIVNIHESVKSACCVFDREKNKIVLFYAGDIGATELSTYIKEKLPRYMVPHILRQLDRMPLNPNGKTDRTLLQKMAVQKA